jgi:hypothetical protein
MNLLIATQFYSGREDAMRRQANCARSLATLHGVSLVNIQPRRDPFAFHGAETLAVLERDSHEITGDGEPRRPILRDVFDALAEAALERRCRYFAFVNSDILVTPLAVEAILDSGKQTYAFSRMDFDGATGRDLGVVTEGIDLFAFDVEWWRAVRQRFRPYILAAWFYDCVFAAIMMTFGDGLVLNRDGEIRHERHPHAPAATSPSALYNGYLAALDSREFSLWVEYHTALKALRQRGATAAEERAMATRVFVWKPSLARAIWHAGRSVRAKWHYTRSRARINAPAAGAPR